MPWWNVQPGNVHWTLSPKWNIHWTFRTLTFRTSDNWTENVQIVSPPQEQTFRPKNCGEMSRYDISSPCNKASLPVTFHPWVTICPDVFFVLFFHKIITFCPLWHCDLMYFMFFSPFCDIFSFVTLWFFCVWYIAHPCACVSPPIHGLVCHVS